VKCELCYVSDVTATVFAHEYFLKVVPTVVHEIGGRGLLYCYQYTYANRVSNSHSCDCRICMFFVIGYLCFVL